MFPLGGYSESMPNDEENDSWYCDVCGYFHNGEQPWYCDNGY